MLLYAMNSAALASSSDGASILKIYCSHSSISLKFELRAFGIRSIEPAKTSTNTAGWQLLSFQVLSFQDEIIVAASGNLP
jgi:hypothetical protein